MAGTLLSGSPPVFAKNNSKISAGLFGEFFTGGSPNLSIGYHKWNIGLGVNLGYASWERDYSEYPAEYNKSNGGIYMLGGRAEYYLPWKIKLKQKSSLHTYMAGEINKFWIKTNWINKATLQKAFLVGVEIFPKGDSFSINVEAGPSWGFDVPDCSATYNIGCRWYIGRGEKK